MLRGFIATGLIIATAVESSGSGEMDIVKYGITQGGLLAVVIVLLWSYRRDFMRIMAKDDEKIVILTTLVATCTEAMVKSNDSTRQLVESVKDLDERRTAQKERS